MRENDVPYKTSYCRKAIRKERLFAKLYAKNKTEENFELKKKYRNRATKEHREKKLNNCGKRNRKRSGKTIKEVVLWKHIGAKSELIKT